MKFTYIELRLLNEAFEQFLIRLNTKKNFIVNYYKTRNGSIVYDYAFIGYITKTGGKHGLHFRSYGNEYYFGTRNTEYQDYPACLAHGQTERIPEYIKKALLEVINSKLSKTVRKSDRQE